MEEHRQQPPAPENGVPDATAPDKPPIGKSSAGILILEIVGAAGLALAAGLVTRYVRNASSAPVPSNDSVWHQAAREAIEAIPLDPTFGEAPVEAEITPDSATESRLVGRWKASIHGEQIIDKRADGTAVLDAKLDFAASLLYGPQLKMQLVWRVEDGVLISEIVEGEPADKVAALIRDRGRSRSYQILEHNENELVLLERDGEKKRQVWTRLP